MDHKMTEMMKTHGAVCRVDFIQHFQGHNKSAILYILKKCCIYLVCSKSGVSYIAYMGEGGFVAKLPPRIGMLSVLLSRQKMCRLPSERLPW